MKFKKLPSAERLHELFEYRDGMLIWKNRPLFEFANKQAYSVWNSKHAGKEAGTTFTTKAANYRRVFVDGVSYSTHRVILKMLNYDVDGSYVDHIDGDSLNNKIENLRLSDASLNQKNVARQKNNKSGFGGVFFRTRRGRHFWTAQVCQKRQQIWLGDYESLLDAVAARLRYNRENGYTMRHGR